MSEYYDSLETRDSAEREKALLAALPAQIAHAKKHAPGFSRILADIDPEAVDSRAALARLPLTRKSDLADLQKQQPPLGGLNATPLNKLAKIFVSPGPVYEPQGASPNWWRSARALFAAGFSLPSNSLQRVFAIVELLRAGRMRDIGTLLDESHASLRDDYEAARAAGLAALHLDRDGRHAAGPDRIRTLSEIAPRLREAGDR